MGALMAAYDWSRTPLGPVRDWSASLRTTVNLCVSSRAPMMVVWGAHHVQLYNDALAPLMGAKHPAAMGQPYAETFPEIWAELMQPLLTAIHDRGESTYLEDQPVGFDRRVPNEEMFWTFSWSPLRDESGVIAGALHPAVETTERVLAQRRLGILRDLATATSAARSGTEVCRAAVGVLVQHPLDTPLSGIFLVDDIPGGLGVPATARLAASHGALDPAAVFPAEVDLTASTYTRWPLAAVAAGRGPEIADTLALDPADLTGWHGPERADLGIVLPLLRSDRSHPLGMLAVGLSPRRPLDEAHLSFLELLAGQLAVALTTASLREQQQQVALTLQRSLLPDLAPEHPALDVAARYQPGARDVEVGGDWYDVVPLGAHRTALVMGDVMGRGVHAAAVMGQMRTAVRAYAQMDLPPERVLELLDGLVEHVSDARDIAQIVTCVYAVHDAGAGTVTLANAGHPPALLLDDGDCRLWDAPVGPPLGVGGGWYETATVPLPPGAGVVLYTDGLIEERDEDLDVGLSRLVVALRGVGTDDLERLADTALSAKRGAHDDDLALLAVRVPLADVPTARTVDLRNDVRAARTARRAVADFLHEVPGAAEVSLGAQLIAAELVNNAITHAGRPRQLRLRRVRQRLVIEVSDGDPRRPRFVPSEVGAEGGRGLLILTELSADWGVRMDGRGKVVWSEVVLG